MPSIRSTALAFIALYFAINLTERQAEVVMLIQTIRVVVLREATPRQPQLVKK